MELGGASSLVLLLAVALWVAYLVPSFVRRRNYVATERNAIRLQQTLRALAETAEAPAELRADVSKRGVAEQQRRLKRAAQAAEVAERERRAAAARDLPAVRAPRTADERRRAAARMRRGRLATTLVGLAGLAGAGVGAWLGSTTGVWWVLVAGVVLVLGAVAMLQRLARVAMAHRVAAERREDDRQRAGVTVREAATAPVPVIERPTATEASVPASAAPEAVGGWTPIAVPKPLYLLRDLADDAAAGGPGSPGWHDGPGGPAGPDGGARTPTVALEALRAAARRSEQAIRDAHAQPGVATFGQVASARDDLAASDASAAAASLAETQPLPRAAIAGAVRIDPIQAPGGRLAARPSRWASMGIVDDVATAASPVRRRRAG